MSDSRQRIAMKFLCQYFSSGFLPTSEDITGDSKHFIQESINKTLRTVNLMLIRSRNHRLVRRAALQIKFACTQGFNSTFYIKISYATIHFFMLYTEFLYNLPNLAGRKVLFFFYSNTLFLLSLGNCKLFTASAAGSPLLWYSGLSGTIQL